MKPVLLVLILFAAACSGGDEPSEQAAATIPEGTCLQLQVVVGEGFRVDGELTPQDQLGATLTKTLEAGGRSAIVDVTCADRRQRPRGGTCTRASRLRQAYASAAASCSGKRACKAARSSGPVRGRVASSGRANSSTASRSTPSSAGP